jgi:gas vesicle protein
MSKYLENRELNDVLESYFDTNSDNIGGGTPELVDESKYLVPIEEGVYFDVLNEKAHFNFAIKFKDDKETKELWQAAKEAEDFLNNNGIEAKGGFEKGWNIVFKVLRIIKNISQISGIVKTGLFIAGVIYGGAAAGAAVGALLIATAKYMVNRLIDWGFRHGQGAMSERNAKKVKTKLIALKKDCKDDESKKKLDDIISNIDDKLKKYQED